MNSYQKLAAQFPGGIEAADKVLCQYVDDSAYSVEEWHEAIECFSLWLRKKNKTSDLLSMLGYISCCSLSQSQMAGVTSLVDTLEQMLADHGFEAIQ